MHLPRPIDPVAFEMHLANQTQQVSIPPPSYALSTLAPVVVPTAGDLKQAAHHADRVPMAAS